MTPRLVLIALAALLLAPAAPASAGSPRDLSIDYVIGMLESGMDQQEIVSRITENHLSFRLEEGDLERLRSAGAGEDLLRAVTHDPWSRPRRIDEPTTSSPPDDQDVDWMTPRRGDYGYGPAYPSAPWWYGYVYYDPFYPYYYYPGVYAYYPPLVYGHGGFHGHRSSGHPGRAPRGSGGSAGSAPRAPRSPRGSH
jgi:hypothetical protein